ncbi:MAG: aminotransferase class I/II-fold pyridoxal phosphate-dependent enzyme [Nitrososphaera sp.]
MGSNDKTAFVKDRIELLKKNGLYRSLRTVTGRGPTAIIDDRQVINLCSNDYRGLSVNKQVIENTISSLYQVSQCSSRLIAGNHPKISELEELLASHRRTESALVYPTGYTANLGVLTALADQSSTIYSDELNHASIVDACRLTRATIAVFRHNDTKHLEELMKRDQGKKIVVTEGIFSMEGDSGKLLEIQREANKYDAITIVDDAHGDFILGPDFSGTPAKLEVNFDIHISSMSKALGCFGGYVSSTSSVKELLINNSRQFIYTSALPDHLCSAAISAIPIAKRGNLQKRLQSNSIYFSSAIKKLGFEIVSSSSHIIPIRIGKETEALDYSSELLREGIFVQAIRYPTVKKGQALLRVSLSSAHEREHLDYALAAFERAGQRIGIF